ncbi:YihY/virulence factor BrkB family protein [Pseudonocardia humida]|nr:YihY/virulence factor BrkB family protein [Pseudonocardia humida]
MLGALDRYQRKHKWLGLPLAVVYKFADDQGAYLAALITYYGFLSLFPLLLIMATVLGFVLPGHPELQQQLIDSALAQFPIIGDQLTSGTQPLRGSGWGLVTGIVVALYGGLNAAVAIQNALDIVWGVPVNKRPNPFLARLRSLAMLGLLGAGVLLTTALTVVGGFGERFGPVVRVGVVVLSVAVNCGLYIVAFRALTVRAVTVREVVPGALLAAVGWQVLQAVGTAYVDGQLRGSTQVYGLFAIVLGLLAWIYLAAVVVVLSAELNAVVAGRLWPRALLGPFIEDVDLTRADRRSYTSYATSQRYRESEEIEVSFRGPDDPPEGRDRDG